MLLINHLGFLLSELSIVFCKMCINCNRPFHKVGERYPQCIAFPANTSGLQHTSVSQLTNNQKQQFVNREVKIPHLSPATGLIQLPY